MKFTAIALLGLLAVASGLKVANQAEFFSHTSADLKAPLNDVIKDIEKEKQDDLNRIEHTKAEQKMKEDDAAEEATKLKAQEAVTADTLKKWQKTQADLKTREEEYSTNDETRSAEEGKIGDIHAEIKKLAETGPTGGTIGVMPASVLAAAKIALTDLLETQHAAPAQKAINLLQRSHAKITEVTSAFKVLSDSITSERKKDTDAVDAQKKIVKAANKVYEMAEAERIARLNAKDEADDRVVVAKTVVAHEQEEYKKAQKLRDDDLATIAKAMKAIDELIATEAKHVAGPTQNLLQVPAASQGAIKKVRDMITAMLSDVAQEEKFQKMILDMKKAAYKKATKERIAAVTAYDAQKMVFHAAQKAWIDAYGNYHRAETDLSQEIAVAEQERRTINAVREMLKKLESAEADVLGSCPLDKIGAVCGGYGDCKTNMTDPARTKYCQCKSGSGRTGRDCSMCKFGWKMATGELKGFCKQVYVPTVSFIQTSEGNQYTVDDLNAAVETMMQTGRHTETSAGIENLLAGLEKKLALKEKMMRQERDDVKRKHDEAETKNHAAKKLMQELEVKMKAAIVEEEKARKQYMAIYTMYQFEHPLRLKEEQLLKKLDDIMVRLAGGEVHNRTEAVTKAALVANNTHTPTTTPTNKA